MNMINVNFGMELINVNIHHVQSRTAFRISNRRVLEARDYARTVGIVRITD